MSERPRLDPTIREYVTRPEIAEDYDRYFARHPLFPFEADFVAGYVVPGSRVLDCGTGTGRHLLPLARAGCRVAGVDLSAPMLRVLGRKLAGSGLEAYLVRADLRELPFAPGPRFDAVLLMFSMLGLIHPAAERERLLRRLAGLLRPDGWLLAHVHNDRYRHSPHTPVRRLRERVKVHAGRLEKGDHLIQRYRGLEELRLHSFTRAEIVSLLGAGGALEVTEVIGLNDRRDGPCEGDDPDRDPNGFFLSARRRH
jgi:SAM-dependent methyltransferase